MRVLLTRLDNDLHRFEVERDDGSFDLIDLETRSMLLHDLVHFALETEAGLTAGFYGHLARGGAYGIEGEGWSEETAAIEMVVARLQSAVKSEVDPHVFVAEVRAGAEALGRPSPDWLTPKMISGALDRLRSLRGRWKALPFGESLELVFPDP